MSTVWENFFKPETRSSGAKLVAQEKVSLAGGSDTAVDAYVRVSPPVKVRLSTANITSETIAAECSCSASQKGQYCKHIWAVLLCAEVKYPDFFIGKRYLEKTTIFIDPEEASAKLRASEYRKAEYQRQKLRAKERKKPKEAKTYPQDVESAIAYFTLNGFPMADDLSEAALGEAKRKLSRVFHPDKGGSHDEVVELNKYCEVIVRYLRG